MQRGFVPYRKRKYGYEENMSQNVMRQEKYSVLCTSLLEFSVLYPRKWDDCLPVAVARTFN